MGLGPPASSVLKTIVSRVDWPHVKTHHSLYPSFRPYGKVLVIPPIVSWLHYEMGICPQPSRRSNGRKVVWIFTSFDHWWHPHAIYDIYRCKRNDDILRIELLSDYKSEISRSCKFKEHLKKRQNAFYMDCFKLSDLVESIFPLESKPTIRTLDVKKQIEFFWHQKIYSRDLFKLIFKGRDKIIIVFLG